jgi:hypothetical protein
MCSEEIGANLSTFSSGHLLLLASIPKRKLKLIWSLGGGWGSLDLRWSESSSMSFRFHFDLTSISSFMVAKHDIVLMICMAPSQGHSMDEKPLHKTQCIAQCSVRTVCLMACLMVCLMLRLMMCMMVCLMLRLMTRQYSIPHHRPGF